MSNVRGRPVQESLKIRHYVMNLIYTHPGEAVMLPSSVERSRMFGVARSTVTLVLQALTREGYIEGKRGIGTFTKCNGTFFPDRRKAPLVGLLYGDGKFFFYEYSAWSLLSCTGRSLTRSLRMVRHLSLVSMSDDEMFDEIRSQYLDVLVWFNASETRLPLIRRLEEAGILIVTCGELPEEAAVDNFRFDLHGSGREMGLRLLAEGRRRVFFAVENDASRSRLRGFEDAYREAGRKLDLHAFREEPSSSVFDQVAAKLEAGVIPDAFYTHGEYLSGILELLKMHHVDTVSQCRMLAEFHTVHTPEFCGIVSEVPFEELGDRIARRVSERLADASAPPVHVSLPVPLKVLQAAR